MSPPKALRSSLSLHFRLPQVAQLLLGSSDTPICICSPSIFSFQIFESASGDFNYSSLTKMPRCVCVCSVFLAVFVSLFGFWSYGMCWFCIWNLVPSMIFTLSLGKTFRVCCVTSNFSMLRSSSQKLWLSGHEVWNGGHSRSWMPGVMSRCPCYSSLSETCKIDPNSGFWFTVPFLNGAAPVERFGADISLRCAELDEVGFSNFYRFANNPRATPYLMSLFVCSKLLLILFKNKTKTETTTIYL